MANAGLDGRENVSSDDSFRALAVVSQAIVSHRDLAALFHELAASLHEVVRFDYLAMILHEPAGNTLRLQILEPAEPALLLSAANLRLGESSAGMVWETQQTLLIPHLTKTTRWPHPTEP